jgi:hypothetical protein
VLVAFYITRVPKERLAGYVEQSTQHKQSVSVSVGTGDFGKGHEGTLVFVLKSCERRDKSLTCRLTVASPGYDRVVSFPPLKTKITDVHKSEFFNRHQQARHRIDGVARRGHSTLRSTWIGNRSFPAKWL